MIQNTQDELDILVGATIIRVDVREDYGDTYFSLHVRFRDGLSVNGETEGFFEVWRDEECNGPGCLAFVGGNGAPLADQTLLERPDARASLDDAVAGRTVPMPDLDDA